ncbi:hypothetical protein [Pseudodesulfovibrio pelocollis]|uniref:hypothetical protein n=1 Tax=Pseudodesulfovibrio pelocollis TaxID=3051432 RepID=UPI00255B271F|nr:hypothetical protein [Pseudodesulfovibrio sp. SB368]
MFYVLQLLFSVTIASTIGIAINYFWRLSIANVMGKTLPAFDALNGVKDVLF